MNKYKYKVLRNPTEEQLDELGQQGYWLSGIRHTDDSGQNADYVMVTSDERRKLDRIDADLEMLTERVNQMWDMMTKLRRE